MHLLCRSLEVSRSGYYAWALPAPFAADGGELD